ncbi:histone-lysine n-methyltransferase [Phlyctema vagabunda]|uniref:Histone-lysine n-methyltransferase n=1 Tax=Phlyctema vagabunda TaxID=108571 RepID=A0ABR4PA22_9HELO
MFTTLLGRLGNTSRAPTREELKQARLQRERGATEQGDSESLHSEATADALSNALSTSSTPPTSIGDSISVSSSMLAPEKDNALQGPSEASPARSRRARTNVGTYNLKALAGTSIHAPAKYAKDAGIRELESRRRTITGELLIGAPASTNASRGMVERDAQRLVRDGIEALDLQWSMKRLPRSKSEIGLSDANQRKATAEELARRKSTRLSGEKIENFTKKLTVLGKRGRKTFEDSLAKASRELRKLADTNEYAGIDTKPVLHEVWSNGKLVRPGEPAQKKIKTEPPAQLTSPKKNVVAPKSEKPEKPEKVAPVGKRQKVWLNKGLYAGQEASRTVAAEFSEKEKTEMALSRARPNTVLPLPMWHGLRLLDIGRNFKLPFDVCSPLPPGQPKPDEWRKSTRNRFIGDAAAAWKTSKHFGDFDSSCVCTADEGCKENCQNRIMFYECDETNCKLGRGCGNRAFADLQDRRKAGGKYRIGVEVIKTADRGYGVRSNRCFDPYQIIVEYNGEIITEEECDRRMNEEYKNNDCYYLMAFDQNMIIDATTGSIARFVNHSCRPNCEMVKWIVAGKPRMALFAGNRPIMTGDELTYDYNFDPFSAKNVQECRCGSDNCRGFLGPKPKDHKFTKETAVEKAVKAGVKAGKRKLKEILGADGAESGRPKKRKIKSATGVKRSASSAGMGVAKGAAKVLKKGVSNQLTSARQAVRGNKRAPIAVKKTVKASILKTYGKNQTKLASKNSTLTVVSASPKSKKSMPPSIGHKSVRKNVVRTVKGGRKNASSTMGASIKVVTIAGEAEDEVVVVREP